MRELNIADCEQVAGGAIPLLVILAAVYHERENVSDFFEGVFEGYENNQNEHN